MIEFEVVQANDPLGQPREEEPESTEQSNDDQEILAKLHDTFRAEVVAWRPVRAEMDRDERFVHNDQWTQEEKAELEGRGQAALTFNQIGPVVRWVTGTEARSKVDWKVLPRTEDDVQAAVVKTDMLKYVSDVTKAGHRRSRAFRDAVSVGLGWTEYGLRGDATDDPLYVSLESWRNIWLDHMSTEHDISDARHIFRSKWVDLDVSQAMFPKHKEAIKSSSVGFDELDYYDDAGDRTYHAINGRASVTSSGAGFAVTKRELVRLIEAWYRKPVSVKKITGRHFGCCPYDESNQDMVNAIARGEASVYDALEMQVWCAVFVPGTLLYHAKSPYKHDRFPFVPHWGFRDHYGAPYGIPRPSIDAQRDLNRRHAKSLYILSTTQIIADSDAADPAVMTWNQIKNEASRPDPLILVKPGAKLELTRDNTLAQQHVDMMMADRSFIHELSGVTGENLGQDTGDLSGKAIVAKQQQGSAVTAEIFENHRMAVQLGGEILLSLVEQFYTMERIVRVTDPRGKINWIKVNATDPGTGERINDISATQADFVVSEQDYRETMRIAMTEQVMNTVSQLPPEAALQFLHLVFELMDLPNKDEFISIARKLNGQAEEGAEPAQPDPRAIAEMQAQEQAAMINQETALAEIEKIHAETDKVRAQTADIAMKYGGLTREY